jgi:hypothetical protein
MLLSLDKGILTMFAEPNLSIDDVGNDEPPNLGRIIGARQVLCNPLLFEDFFIESRSFTLQFTAQPAMHILQELSAIQISQILFTVLPFLSILITELRRRVKYLSEVLKTPSHHQEILFLSESPSMENILFTAFFLPKLTLCS